MSLRVAVLTPNPAIDVTYALDADRPGQTNRVRRVARRAGGKGLNVAGVLTVLGAEVRCILPVGGAAGAWMRDALASGPSPAQIDSIPLSGETRTTVTIVGGSDQPTVYAEPGPALASAEWDAVTESVAHASRAADFLVVAGSLPAAAPPHLVADWARAGRAGGALVVIDTSGEALIFAARGRADIVKPNAEELLDATGTASVEKGVAALREAGASRIVISRGADGLDVFDAGRCSAHRVPAVPGITGNPTGAGDAATAGLVAALGRGHTLLDAARWAAAAGAAAVRQPAAGSIDLTDFDTYLESLGAPERGHEPPRAPARHDTAGEQRT